MEGQSVGARGRSVTGASGSAAFMARIVADAPRWATRGARVW
jgi:hypothetical protein